MKTTIEITVSPQGDTRLETKGFAGATCRDASHFIENALGEMLSDQPTAEAHRATQEKTQDVERA